MRLLWGYYRFNDPGSLAEKNPQPRFLACNREGYLRDCRRGFKPQASQFNAPKRPAMFARLDPITISNGGRVRSRAQYMPMV